MGGLLLARILTLCLLNQSVNYDNSGDKIQSLQAIEEAYTITQTLAESIQQRSLIPGIVL
jgi:hypothetical protein